MYCPRPVLVGKDMLLPFLLKRKIKSRESAKGNTTSRLSTATCPPSKNGSTASALETLLAKGLSILKNGPDGRDATKAAGGKASQSRPSSPVGLEQASILRLFVLHRSQLDPSLGSSSFSEKETCTNQRRKYRQHKQHK
jgi:hypothetical protein